MTDAELADLLEEVVSRLRKREPTGGRSFLKTESEIAKSLGVSERHMRRLRAMRLIPFVKLGKSVRYNPEAVERAIEKLTINEIGAGRARR